MADAIRNSQNVGGIFKVPRAGTNITTAKAPRSGSLDQLIDDAINVKKPGTPIKYFKPEMIGLKSPVNNDPISNLTSGLANIGSMIQMALGGVGAAITGNINTVEHARQNFVGGIESQRQSVIDNIQITPKLKDGSAPINNLTPKGGVCGEDCNSLGNPVSISGCKARKYLHGCGHPGTSTDIADHDQDCANYMGFGGLLDGVCVAGKGGTKAKDQWIIPLAVGGVLIIGIIVAMK